jgi:hypothetical protein
MSLFERQTSKNARSQAGDMVPPAEGNQDMSMFRIGQQVVCIKRGPWRWHPQDGGEDVCQEGPKFGEVVTIDGFHWEDDRFLLLNGWPMLAFDPFQFRPVKKTDISVFTAMLNPVRQKEKA